MVPRANVQPVLARSATPPPDPLEPASLPFPAAPPWPAPFCAIVSLKTPTDAIVAIPPPDPPFPPPPPDDPLCPFPPWPPSPAPLIATVELLITSTWSV